ncbi:hypothetical protein DEI84_07125 [Curtobacterium sp. MCBD17_023]|nr:hypothetical protein DEI84_07125 [Curtobacterium sp. MCBD17_023]
MQHVTAARRLRTGTSTRSQHLLQRPVRLHLHCVAPALTSAALSQDLGGSWAPGADKWGLPTIGEWA